jgi:hypothetical protein
MLRSRVAASAAAIELLLPCVSSSSKLWALVVGNSALWSSGDDCSTRDAAEKFNAATGNAGSDSGPFSDNGACILAWLFIGDTPNAFGMSQEC